MYIILCNNAYNLYYNIILMFDDILEKATQVIEKNKNLDGFTVFLKWEEKRYIIAFTNNVIRGSKDIARVKMQLLDNAHRDSLTIGWWKDKETGKFYIDLWVATDDLREATRMGRRYNQIAIFDMKELQEIRV